MFTMEQGINAKLKAIDTKFRTEMSSGVSHMKEFEKEAEGLGRNTLGANPQLPSGYMVGSLWFLDQSAHLLPSGYFVIAFKKYPSL